MVCENVNNGKRKFDVDSVLCAKLVGLIKSEEKKSF